VYILHQNHFRRLHLSAVAGIYGRHFSATISTWRECLVTLESLRYCGESDEVVRFTASLITYRAVSALFAASLRMFLHCRARKISGYGFLPPEEIKNTVSRHFITSATRFLSYRKDIGALPFRSVADLWRGVFPVTGFILP
jgi:hypothetical protein